MIALAIDANRSLLNRYRFVEHEAMFIFAGWLPRIATFELKCETARALWENAQHVNALYLRLREIQSPAFQDPSDATIVALMREMLNAPDEFGLLLAYARVLAPDLIRALENHEKETFSNSDFPSVYAISHILLDLRSQVARLEPLLNEAQRTGRVTAEARAWEAVIRELLAAAGGVGGRGPRPSRAPAAPPARPEFRLPLEAARDSRFTNRGSDFEVMPAEEDYGRHTTEEFERYSTEVLAAETVAVVLFSLRGMVWEFQFDTARHLYDEIRHALMGYEWMRRHGMDPFESPQYLQVFRWRSQFPPVMQYCMLTMGNEVHAFPYRHRRVEAHQRSGDELSEQFVRYDIADETQHVRFGKRWLPALLQHLGERRSVEQYTEDALKVWETQYKTGKLTLNVE